MWKSFRKWGSTNPDPRIVLRLLEVSSEFPKGEYNALFRQELDRKASEFGDEAQQQAMQLHDFDWVGYIARSVRSAGFREADVDPQTHELVVRLLVKPGKLFRGWDGMNPLVARFKVAVKNAIINSAQKRMTRRKRIPSWSVDQNPVAGIGIPAQASMTDSVTAEFKAFLRDRHGQAAVDLLNQRLDGAETKELIGKPGLETAYRVKQLVLAIKKSAEEFAAGDEKFLALVRRAMRGEAELIKKRFAGKLS